jgi:hypothetical protein
VLQNTRLERLASGKHKLICPIRKSRRKRSVVNATPGLQYARQRYRRSTFDAKVLNTEFWVNFLDETLTGLSRFSDSLE